MSQTTKSHDRTDTDSIAETLLSELEVTDEVVESVTESDVSAMEDKNLVDVRKSLKQLENAVESVRKELVDSELENRIEPGEKMFGLNRIESHSKYVQDDEGKIIMRAVSEGIDYTEFIEIKASKLAKVAPEIAEIGKNEYTYFR